MNRQYNEVNKLCFAGSAGAGWVPQHQIRERPSADAAVRAPHSTRVIRYRLRDGASEIHSQEGTEV